MKFLNETPSGVKVDVQKIFMFMKRERRGLMNRKQKIRENKSGNVSSERQLLEKIQ